MYVNIKLQYRLLNRNIRYSYIDGIAYTFMMGTTVPYLGLYILRFHGPAELVSLIAAVQPVVLFIVSLLAASYVNRIERKKQVAVAYGLAVRLFIMVMAFIPFLPPNWHAWALFTLWGMMFIPWGFCSLSWSPMMCNIIPESMRGSFFGTRNALTAISSLAGTFFTGFILAKTSFYAGFTIIFLISFVCVMISQYFLTQHMEPVMALPEERKAAKQSNIQTTGLNLKANLLAFTHPQFGRVFTLSSIALFIFHIGYSMSIPLYTLRQVQQLGFDNATIALITAAQSLTALAGSYIGGRCADRYGYRYVLLFSTIVSVVPPLVWSLANQLPLLVFASLINGLAGNAYMICFQFMVLAFSPYEERSRFVAVNTAIGNLAGTIGPLLGMFLMNSPMVSIQGALIAAGLFMLGGAIYAFRIAKNVSF